jgi:hypothetical protein
MNRKHYSPDGTILKLKKVDHECCTGCYYEDLWFCHRTDSFMKDSCMPKRSKSNFIWIKDIKDNA